MSKTKTSSKSAKPAKSDILSKVKDSGITKSSQSVMAKAKDIAKDVVGKTDKKSKKEKKVKEPTPEPSESENSSDSEADSDSSDDDSEAEVKQPSKPSTNGKVNGAKAATKDDDSEEDSESDESESSEDEAPKANGNKKAMPAAAAKDGDSEDDSDESSDDDDEDEQPAAKNAAKGADTDSDEESSEADSDDSDDSSEDEEEEEAKPKVTKRKAEEEDEPVSKKSKTAGSTPATSANLFVGNLSWNVDDGWLRETFEAHGELTRVQVMTDRQTGRSKGFGYVEFVNAADAATAHAEKQGFELDGRALNVDFANSRPDATERQDNRRKSYGDQVSEPSDTLFLGNLSFDVGQEAVTEAFSPHGTVLGIRLPTDRETGQPKGFGYVTFSSVEEAQGALEAMQGGYIGGRPIRLDYSQPRPQNNDSPGRGRGRGGFGGGFGGRGGAGGRGGRGGRGGFGGGRGGDRGGRGGRGGSTNRGGFGDFSGRKTSFD